MNTSIDNPNYNSIDARSKSVMNTQQTYKLRKGSPSSRAKKAEKCSRGVPCSTSRQQHENKEEYMMNDKLIMNLRSKLNHGKMRVNPRNIQNMLQHSYDLQPKYCMTSAGGGANPGMSSLESTARYQQLHDQQSSIFDSINSMEYKKKL